MLVRAHVRLFVRVSIFCRNNPVFCQKSLTYWREISICRHFFRTKKIRCVRRSYVCLYVWLYSIEKALCSVTNSLLSGERALHSGMSSGRTNLFECGICIFIYVYLFYICVSMLFPEMCVYVPSKSPTFCPKEPYILAHQPCIPTCLLETKTCEYGIYFCLYVCLYFVEKKPYSHQKNSVFCDKSYVFHHFFRTIFFCL